MRIALDRKNLLGFEDSQTRLGVPTTAAKVGNKTVIVGVASAKHTDLVRTSSPSTALTFPTKVD